MLPTRKNFQFHFHSHEKKAAYLMWYTCIWGHLGNLGETDGVYAGNLHLGEMAEAAASKEAEVAELG
jgi:hypothetical protein